MKYTDMTSIQLMNLATAAFDKIKQPGTMANAFSEDMSRTYEEYNQVISALMSKDFTFKEERHLRFFKGGVEQGRNYSARLAKFTANMEEGAIIRNDCEVCGGFNMLQLINDEPVEVSVCGCCHNFFPVEKLINVSFGLEPDMSEPDQSVTDAISFLEELLEDSFLTIDTDLCATCIQKLGRKWIQWGVMFCDKEGCDGFHENTGNTKPIGKNQDGYWIESKCNQCGKVKWEPFD